MNIQIQRHLQAGNLVLLLGAGASVGSFDRSKRSLLTSKQLSQLLAEKAKLDYHDEQLDVVYSAALSMCGSDGLSHILQERFSGCTPSRVYEMLARYPWNRIYTLNIDDAFERALFRHSPQDVSVRQRNDPIVDQDQNFKRLDYIKLNGSIDRLDIGLIFSPQEYGAASAKTPTWYSELARDFFRTPFLFIGTQLKEPLFYHQLERFRERSKSIEPTSFVLTPSATSIEKVHLRSIKLEHIAGTSDDFSTFLERNVPSPPSTKDLAIARRPELELLYNAFDQSERDQYIAVLSNVISVSRQAFQHSLATADESGNIRNFYRGFKPRWLDILDDVPARFSILEKFLKIFDDIPATKQLVVVHGPAGSGKTTLLMQAALIIHERLGLNCYFLPDPVDNLSEVVKALDKANGQKYFVFSDALDLLVDQIVRILETGLSDKCIFVASERQHIWEDRVLCKVGSLPGCVFMMPLIGAGDAESILAKLQEYGPWTRLQHMSQSQRIHELVQRSKRQLLIGLMETTQGKGFEEIIRADFERITLEPLRYFVLAVGLATMHRRPMPFVLVARVLDRLGIAENPASLASKLSGIAYTKNGALWIRHPVYVRELFENISKAEETFNVIVALMEAFSAYKAPVIKSVSRSDGVIFKSVLNHRFLRTMFRTELSRVIDLYMKFETVFSVDGLYWLQYGLALRDIDDQEGALDKLETAYEAYPMVHTEHALAQQRLIMALRSSDRTTSLGLLDDARAVLERLDSVLESDDTYPIVTLSEGHTQVIERFDGIDAARRVAEKYLQEIDARFRRRAKPARVAEAETRLRSFVLTGNWANASAWAEYS